MADHIRAQERGLHETPAEQIQHLFLGTYFTLRVGMAVLAFALPILLFVLGPEQPTGRLMGSMSAYYYSANPTARDVFVGSLCALGLSLWAYKGFTRREDIALSLAGVFAIGVALCPTPWKCDPRCPTLPAHVLFAVLFFVCIGYVAVWRAGDTVYLLDQERHRAAARWFRRAYRVLGVVMLLLPPSAAVVARLFQKPQWTNTTVFWLESAAVYAFAAYWITKSFELSRSGAERMAVSRELTHTPHRPLTRVSAPSVVFTEERLARASAE